MAVQDPAATTAAGQSVVLAKPLGHAAAASDSASISGLQRLH